MTDIITPRPVNENCVFALNMTITFPRGKRVEAVKQARMKSLTLLESVMGSNEPITFWFSESPIAGVAGPDGMESATIILNVVMKSAERRFGDHAKRMRGPYVKPN